MCLMTWFSSAEACGIDRAFEYVAIRVELNTLRYRIGRFEEMTGANLRHSRSALEVWWALQRDALQTPA
jgi:sugar diacid utilization regulator